MWQAVAWSSHSAGQHGITVPLQGDGRWDLFFSFLETLKIREIR